MTDTALGAALALVAALFAAVGQAGGAGYVAVLALAGEAPGAIRPVSLLLTLLVAAIGVVHFHRLRLLRWRDAWPFALLGVPGAIAGAIIALPASTYRVAISLLMLAAAAQMLRMARGPAGGEAQGLAAPPLLPAILAGGAIGLAAGITGIGGGIFVMPLLLSLRWAPTQRAAAIAQANNLITAGAALLGLGAARAALPPELPWLALAAAGGGICGAWMGTRYLSATMLRLVLALILLGSGLKLLLA